jgi:outer membrane lipoprotein carrier protein
MDSGRFSRRRLPARTELLALLAAVAGVAEAQPPAADVPPDGLTILESFLTEVHSLTADFTSETVTVEPRRLLATDIGTLALERPNRFRWSSEKPTELIVVADGEIVWTYDVELEQITKAPFDESIASSPAMLLAGDRGVRDGFDVVGMERRDGLDWVTLRPKADGSDFSSLAIGFDGTVPQRLELVDGMNETTRIKLDNVVVNPVLGAEVFEFEPPAGVKVLGDRG